MTFRKVLALVLVSITLIGLSFSFVNTRYVEPINIQRDLLGEWVTPAFQLPSRDAQGGGRMWETAWSYDLDQQGEAFISSRYGCQRDRANILVCTRCRFIRTGICFLEQQSRDSGYYRTVTVEQGHLVVGEGFAPPPRQVQ
jgi:hypothetical protein